jgi:hypothetical protein
MLKTAQSKSLHTLDAQTSESATTSTDVTYWRPAIPLPLYVGFGLRKCQCFCGKRFKDRKAYEAHYLYAAVWEGQSNYIVRITPAPTAVSTINVKEEVTK